MYESVCVFVMYGRKYGIRSNKKRMKRTMKILSDERIQLKIICCLYNTQLKIISLLQQHFLAMRSLSVFEEAT